MKEALRQARKGIGRTSPNPMVGSVIVRNGKIIASGYHKKAGENHAELEALARISGKIRDGDTLYVTLEPCTHYGKMPPCTEAIIKSGLKKVVMGMQDPNPHVSGNGFGFLKEKGIEVKTGVLESECRRLNESYIKWVTTGRPFVILKSAQTMDGWTATSTGHSKWITNEKSRQYVHMLRDRVDAVMVGIGTVISDDPSLTTRLKNGQGRDPIRIIVDTHFRTPEDANVLNHESASMTFLAIGDDAPPARLKMLEKDRVSTIVCPIKNRRVDLAALLSLLGRMSVLSLLVEGGSGITGSLIRERLIDKFYIFKALKILGGDDGFAMAAGTGPKKMDESMKLKDLKVDRLEDDFLFIGYPG